MNQLDQSFLWSWIHLYIKCYENVKSRWNWWCLNAKVRNGLFTSWDEFIRITGLGYKRFKSGFDLTELRVSNRQLETIALINTQWRIGQRINELATVATREKPVYLVWIVLNWFLSIELILETTLFLSSGVFKWCFQVWYNVIGNYCYHYRNSISYVTYYK